MKKILLSVFALSILLPTLAFASFDTSLKYGSRGDAVIELQDLLIAQGFLKGNSDGRYGLVTLNAVKTFQTANGLSSDGYFGKASRAKASSILADQLQSSNNAEQTETGTIASTANPTTITTTSTVVGCTSVTAYSPTTGQACNAIATAVQQLQQTVQQNQNAQQIAQNSTLPAVVTPTPTPLTSSGSSQSIGGPITVNISANPQEVKWGYGTMLTWVSKNATYCVPSDGPNESNWPNYSKNTSYSYYTGQLYKTTTYSLTCYNAAGQSGSNSITFNIDQPVEKASGSLSSDSTSCIVAENSNFCQVGLWWNIPNAAAPHLMNRDLGNALSNEANISNIDPLSVTVNYPQTTFDLKNGNDLLDTETIKASCATGTIWDRNLCRR